MMTLPNPPVSYVEYNFMQNYIEVNVSMFFVAIYNYWMVCGQCRHCPYEI